jgi:hypothetical protein
VGNDGLHYDNDLNAAPVIPEGQSYADALVLVSDHLPVRVDVALGDASDTRPPRITARLLPPSPNPPRPETRLGFELEGASEARLEIFDAAGRRVATLARGGFAAGRHAVIWRGRDDGGRPVRSGVYFLRLSGPHLATQKTRLTVLR